MVTALDKDKFTGWHKRDGEKLAAHLHREQFGT
jgi:hypothetical protein